MRICHLYPELMNLYGDRGNIIALSRRSEWMGIRPVVEGASLGESNDFTQYDVLFVGGGQDREQRLICTDLQKVKGDAIKDAVESGVVVLAICGGYQLLGRYYKTGNADEVLPGLGVFDAYTVAGSSRLIGNVVAESCLDTSGRTLVGFENHSGKTYLGQAANPLAKIIIGHGNNGEDGYEGCVYKNCIGTYLHGSLLPKNPWLTDHLIKTAVSRRYPDLVLPQLDDTYENIAHESAIARAKQRPDG